MGFPKSFKTIEITQQCSRGFTKEYVQNLVDGWSSVKDYAYIVHDKDKNKDGSDIEPHLHLMLRFKDSVPTQAILKKVEKVCDISQLEKMKNWNSAIAYLTHSTYKAKLEGKYLYNDDEVISNFDWLIDRQKALADSSARLTDIITGIDNGIIREYNYYEYISMQEYTKYKKQIDVAFKYRIDRLEGANRQMECIFISGESGCGKTTYAKRICEDKGFSFIVSSGSNDVLDSYKGHDAIILDDLRPSCLGLSDLLKLLDNNTASSVKSRYKNKVLECRLIIITTTLDIDTFFSHVFESEYESKIQLMRRCKTYIKMSLDGMKVYIYDRLKREYKLALRTENPIEFIRQPYNDCDLMDFAESILGNTLEGVKKIEKDDYMQMEFIPLDDEIPFT